MPFRWKSSGGDWVRSVTLFRGERFLEKNSSVEEFVQNVPIAELLPGGQFTERWHAWLAKERLVPKVFARVSSFTELANIVQAGHAAAVLPDMAAVDFDPKRYAHRSIPALRNRTLVLFANARSLERSGIARGVEARLSEELKLG
jgi:DNA-binding transcriptional LysR family regulator